MFECPPYADLGTWVAETWNWMELEISLLALFCGNPVKPQAMHSSNAFLSWNLQGLDKADAKIFASRSLILWKHLSSPVFLQGVCLQDMLQCCDTLPSFQKHPIHHRLWLQSSSRRQIQQCELTFWFLLSLPEEIIFAKKSTLWELSIYCSFEIQFCFSWPCLHVPSQPQLSGKFPDLCCRSIKPSFPSKMSNCWNSTKTQGSVDKRKGEKRIEVQNIAWKPSTI